MSIYMPASMCLHVHTCVYMCQHVFFSFLAFICCIMCKYVLFLVYFCDLYVYLTCAGMWAIYVFHKTHPFAPNSKFAVDRDFSISLSVCVFCVTSVFFLVLYIIFFLTSYK